MDRLAILQCYRTVALVDLAALAVRNGSSGGNVAGYARILIGARAVLRTRPHDCAGAGVVDFRPRQVMAPLMPSVHE